MKYTKSLATLVLVSSVALGLAACSDTKSAVSATDSASAKPVSAPTASPVVKSTPSPTVDSKKSSRGNLLMAVGDTGIISDGSSKAVTTKFTINSITPGACDQPYSHAVENGNIVLVDITVETTPELAQSSYPKYTLSGNDFKFIAANGTTFNGGLNSIATYSCIADSLKFPSSGMGPGEKVTAKVVLDVPATSGILVLKSGYSGGFEYKF